MLVRVFMAVAFPLAIGGKQMDIKLDALNIGLGFAGDMQLVTVEIELGQLGLERLFVDTKVDHRAEEHVAADAAENIEVKCLHPITITPCP